MDTATINAAPAAAPTATAPTATAPTATAPSTQKRASPEEQAPNKRPTKRAHGNLPGAELVANDLKVIGARIQLHRTALLKSESQRGTDNPSATIMTRKRLLTFFNLIQSTFLEEFTEHTPGEKRGA